MQQAGFRLVFATDLEPACAASHARNFPRVPFHLANISDLTEEKLREHIGVKTKVDVVVGGPPCPPFSKSRFYRKEKPRAFEDPVGWETFSGYLRVVKLLEPRAFMLENVAGLAYEAHRDALQHLLDAAKSLGYATSWQVLNAADFGVPQIRERCFVVGIRGERPFDFPSPTHTKAGTGDLFADSLEPWRTAGDVLTALDTEVNADDEGHFAGGKHHHLLREIPPGDNYLFFTKERGHSKPQFRWRSRYWSFLLKLSPSMPSWTIQARRSNNMGPFHWRNRILRIAEVKRLQTFPDDWFLSGTTEQQWRQLGNAVPPLLAKQLGICLKQQISSRASTPRARKR